TVPHHEDTMTQRYQFVQIRRADDQAGACRRRGEELAVELRLGADVDSLGRLVPQQHPPPPPGPPAPEELLLVYAPEQRQALAHAAERPHAEPLEPRTGLGHLLAAVQAKAVPERLEVRYDHVLASGELHDAALDLPIRRQVGETARHGQVRPLRLDL